jgi:hypothetical protein
VELGKELSTRFPPAVVPRRVNGFGGRANGRIDLPELPYPVPLQGFGNDGTPRRIAMLDLRRLPVRNL